MTQHDTDRMLAMAQVALAFFYGAMFVGIFILMAAFWSTLSKFDVGLLTMFATGAMNQSKDAGSFFFARQRPPALPDPNATTITTPTPDPTGSTSVQVSSASTPVAPQPEAPK